MPTSGATNDEAQEREINEAVEACRKAMADLEVDAKATVLRELHRWLVAEHASHDSAAAPEKRH